LEGIALTDYLGKRMDSGPLLNLYILFTYLLAQGTKSSFVLRQSYVSESQGLTQNQIYVGAQLLTEGKDFLWRFRKIRGVSVFLIVGGEQTQSVQG